VVEFRANGGKTFGIFRDQPLLLLTTTGAKSGEPRTTPLVYTRDGDRFVIVASNGGTASHPSWFLYVVAHPEVTVDGGSERLTMRAAVPEGEARDQLYARQIGGDARVHGLPGENGTWDPGRRPREGGVGRPRYDVGGSAEAGSEIQVPFATATGRPDAE
jgi:deazaflavin-dependent oxidoreductase (nitroreductase family)